MVDMSAPILEVGKAYLIGESQRGLLITNDIVFTPVLGFFNTGLLTESVLIHSHEYNDLGPFLNRVHAAQVHVGDFLMTSSGVRIMLGPRATELMQNKTWPGTVTGVVMACAQGFAMTALGGASEVFETSRWRELPMMHHYQLCWVDREGNHHAFTDIVEVN